MSRKLHLYWFATAPPGDGDAVPPQWNAWLSERERARAARYVRPSHGRRYAVAHARLREILARHLACRPEEIGYVRGAHGKPELAPALEHRGIELHAGPLRFNLSHSGEYALVGVSDGALGVDIEGERPRLDGLAIAHRYFTPPETAWLEALAPEQRARGFSRLWTCKEAVLKADGRGLALPLKSFEVSLPPSPGAGSGADAARLLDLASPRRHWWVGEFDLMPGYAAAAVQAEPPREIVVERL